MPTRDCRYRDSCRTPFLDQSTGEGLNVPPMIAMQREQPVLLDFGRASADSGGPHARWLSLIYLENAPFQVNQVPMCVAISKRWLGNVWERWPTRNQTTCIKRKCGGRFSKRPSEIHRTVSWSRTLRKSARSDFNQSPYNSFPLLPSILGPGG